MTKTYSRESVGLAIRASREAARLTLNDLATQTGITKSSLSRSERGERDLALTEALPLTEVLGISLYDFLDLVETFERAGTAERKRELTELEKHINEIQQLALEAVIEAKANR